MTQDEGKIILAEFMGAEVEKPYNDYGGISGVVFYYPKDTSPSIYRNLGISSIEYYTSYDWIIPVVRKISKLQSLGDINGLFSSVMKAVTRLEIPAVIAEKAVEFLKWNNNAKKTI